MTIELILELPAGDGTEAEFPDASTLPRTGPIGHVSGLDGEQVLQLAVIVSTASVRVLRTWLLARAERLKHSRVVWEGQVWEGYTAKEIDLLMRSLERRIGEEDYAATSSE
jgi:hypothetical protein